LAGFAAYLKFSRTAQTTPEVKTMVEYRSRYSPAFEKQRCHFIYHVEPASGIALEGNAGSDEPVVAEETEESILDAFDLDLDDVSPMN
jgi:hypothetical protein